MKIKTLLYVVLCVFPCIIYGQTWDGGGDGTSWQDSLNWSGDLVPEEDAIVSFMPTDSAITITGYAPFIPKKIEIGGGQLVTFAMDSLKIGNGSTVDHGVQMLDFGKLLILKGTYTIEVPNNRNAFSFFASADSADVKIEDNAVVNILKAQVGVNISSSSSIFTNNGSLNIFSTVDGIRLDDSSAVFYNNGPLAITGSSSDGIDNIGMFQNNYTLSITNARTTGINNKSTGRFINDRFTLSIICNEITTDGINNEGSFLNKPEGTLFISKATDDCVETLDNVFENQGTIIIEMKESSNTGNNGLAIGSNAKTTSFINSSSQSLYISSPDIASARLISIFPGSTLENSGAIFLEDSVISNSTIFAQGHINNLIGGRIDLGLGGRINLDNNGVLVNDGLIVSKRGSTAIQKSANTSSATNNAYYDYGVISPFSTGVTGTESNFGIDLHDPQQTLINAGDSCNIDIAQVSYLFMYLDDTLGMTNDTGLLMIPENSINGDTVLFVNANFPEVRISVINYCLLALPVVYEEFRLERKEEGVMLIWVTSEERNNSHFEVQKSTDGRSFASFDTVLPKDGFDRQNEYQSLDEKPADGLNYYRIKQVDLDGRFSFSPVRKIIVDKREIGILAPNAVLQGESILLKLSKTEQTGSLQPRIYDATGRVIVLSRFSGQQDYVIETTDLNPGMYFIKLSPESTALPFVILGN